MNRPEILARIRDAARRRGAKVELARALDYSRPTIRDKLRRDDGFTDDELRRAAAALGVAADPPAGSGMAEAPAPYEARLTAIGAGLGAAAQVPAERPELRKTAPFDRYLTDLREISRASDATDAQRARADALLQAAYDDPDAAERMDRRLDASARRMLAGLALFDRAVTIVGWSPPPVFREALRGVAFRRSLDIDDLVTLLRAAKAALEEDRERRP